RLPDAQHAWLVDPVRQHPEPHGETRIEWGSGECIEALEAADLVVANTHTDLDWRKREGATYLQTWHGTPLKRIHRDVLWAPPGRLERLSRDVAQWDLLVSPNSASTPRLRQAFAFDGEVIETGYPRNDVLSSPTREALRGRIRAQLWIPAGHTAVLYAPTWRDDAVLPGGGKDFALGLDVDAFEERLGANHVLLLRLHYLLTGRLEAMSHESVRDVSHHPDISELYLAADVLVTDYSSVMFDFAITGKPQLFFTYDLEDYGNRLRGFYFDLAPIAPGPLLATNGELLDALADLPAVAAGQAKRYAAFRETFCHLEDGRATERVLDRLLG
ncbi:MAG TPA: CDP-glycerol glycerophosphotransferase family protein, partial [Thermoleophilaceae bacterium]|nr:CDP-glycerol glycerophosphotransferase family protein [Thermoleophilaceae bacterium]